MKEIFKNTNVIESNLWFMLNICAMENNAILYKCAIWSESFINLAADWLVKGVFFGPDICHATIDDQISKWFSNIWILWN